MASELEFRMWLEALTRQNEQEPPGYPKRLELEQNLLQAFHEAKAQEQRAYEALHNQIESQKGDWEKAISSLRQAAEEKRELEQQLAQARETLKETQGQLIAMQTRAIEAEKAVEGAHTSAALAKEDLAQAQKEIEHWKARDAVWTESQAKAVTLYAQARVLLERPSELLENMCHLLTTPPSFKADAERWLEKYRAFLAHGGNDDTR